MMKLQTILKILFISCLIYLSACSHMSRRGEQPTAPNANSSSANSKSGVEGQPETPVISTPDVEIKEPEAPIVQPTAPIKNMPRIGLILGPGAIKAYAHIGVLQELAKAKIKIHAIAGIEMGALFAGLYAKKEQAYDVEWQSFKLTEEDLMNTSLLASDGGSKNISELKDFFSDAFKSLKSEDASIPFVCPSINYQKHQMFLMSKGGFDQLLPYCMSFPPLWKSYGNSYANPYEISKVSDYLRRSGANYIIYVNVLPNKDSVGASSLAAENQLIWDQVYQTTIKKTGADQIIMVDTSEFSLTDVKKRRQLAARGAEAGKNAASIIVKKFGL